MLTQLKQIAVREHRSLAALVEEVLREAVSRRLSPAGRPRIKLPAYGAGGVAPGIDLSNTRSLLEHADEFLPLEKRG